MPGPALIGAGASILGGVLGGGAQRRAAGDASAAQLESTRMQIQAQRQQYNRFRRLSRPYVQAGLRGLTGFENLIGTNGAAAQGQAIDGIANGPQFQALAQQGEDALLQNASATGGLRGGNTAGALAQFRPQMLDALIQRQTGLLGGLAGMGQNAIVGVGNAGTNMTNAISQAYGDQGAARAGNALAQGQITSNLFSGIAGTIGNLAGQVDPASTGNGFQNWRF